MGINGLLPYLKQIQKDRNISQYSNQTVAIDSYCWLHKAIYSCALDLATGVQTDKYIVYCLKRIEVLLSYRIRPVVIFDGGPLPSKAKTESDRESSREEKRKQAIELLKAGNTHLAQRKFGESIDVTPQLAFNLYKALREKYNVECIVSPYEADAQLAYLSRIGYVDVIITEDSDLLTFGAKRVFYKMDGNGNGKEISLEDIKTIRGDVSPDAWNHKLFLSACILAGCDYLQSIRGVGFKKAYKMMGDMKNYKAVIKHLKLEGKYMVPHDYEENLEKAFLTFRFQRVFCPLKRRLVTLNDIDNTFCEGDNEKEENEPNKISNGIDTIVETNLIAKVLENSSSLDFLGPDMSVEMAQNIAYGIIDPITKKPYLTESNINQTSQMNSWLFDGQKPSKINVQSLLRSSSFASDGSKLEDEFSNQSSTLSQVNQNDRAKFYKVAKPKLVGLSTRDGSKVKDGQKNLRDFFREATSSELEGSRTFKIKSFFNAGRALKDNVLTLKVEETLAPSDASDLFEDLEDKKEQLLGQINEQEEPHLGSVLKKQDSFSKQYDIYSNKNAGCVFRNSKSVNKAFKIPTAVKKDEEEQSANILEKNLKRKLGISAIESFNEFTFKKIQKKEALVSYSKDNRKETYTYEAKLPFSPSGLFKEKSNEEGVLDSVRALNRLTFESTKKADTPIHRKPRKTVYKINLTTLKQAESLEINKEALSHTRCVERSQIQNFFKLNPITKSQLKNIISEKGNQKHIRFDTDLLRNEENLDERLSTLFFDFK